MADPVLVFRPEPGNARTGEALRELDFTPILYPLYTAEALAWTPPLPAEIDAILLTSANAARLGGPGLSRFAHLPVFAVGEATAKAAGEAGFRAVETGGGDAASTVPLIAAAGHHHVLHFGGQDMRSYDPHGLTITRLPVYRMAERGDAAGLARALPRDRGVYGLVHSPRAGERLAALLSPGDRHRMSIVAISETASDACGAGWRQRIFVGLPTEAAMLAGLQMLV
ncbi:uroporphyrinogen-III synthase [soil metagenome]